MKGDSSICIGMHAKDLDMKINNFFSIKCYKEMNDTIFSLGLIFLVRRAYELVA